MADFFVRQIGDPVELLDAVGEFGDEWVYRGQLSRFGLQTRLERALINAGSGLAGAAGIEREMVRSFQRLYDGNDRATVRSDRLYCLSLMQHHGAPTRLLDWTYSPFVAAYFALESAHDHWVDGTADNSCAVWCLNQQWCSSGARKVAGDELIEKRNKDETRNDVTFLQLYMNDTPFRLIFLENPLLLHMRLHLQQGLFLCPGDVSVPLEENLTSLERWQERDAITKLVCKIEKRARLDRALEKLWRMNVHRETLFPGLDGFAQSMKYRLFFYGKLATWRTDKVTS